MPSFIDGEMLPPPAASIRGRDNHTYGGNNAFHNFYNDYSHITDPNLRRRLALSEIDKVPFGLYRMYRFFNPRAFVPIILQASAFV
jgi:PHS family inorganic phosphate transporter-like MFS transporter